MCRRGALLWHGRILNACCLFVVQMGVAVGASLSAVSDLTSRFPFSLRGRARSATGSRQQRGENRAGDSFEDIGNVVF